MKRLLAGILALCLLLAGCGAPDGDVLMVQTQRTADAFATAAATEAPTEPLTQPTTIPTEAPTEAPTEPSTEVPTEAPTEVPTEPLQEIPTESQEEEPATDNSQAYVLNKNTKKFHYPHCSSVSRMKEKNRKDFYGSREEVLNRGYVPCKNCDP